MAKTLFIRAEASAEIGLGHLMRSLALARILIEHGQWSVTFLLKAQAQALFEKLEAHIPFLTIAHDGPEEWMALSSYSSQRPDVFLVDSYELGPRYFEQLRLQLPGTLILAFDDNQEKSDFALHGILNLSLTSLAIDYPGHLLKYSLIGPSFYPLRPEFLAAKVARSFPAKIPRLTITMGGADPDHQTLRLLEMLISRPQLHQLLGSITVVVGPAFASSHAVYDCAKRLPQTEVLLSPPDMAQVFDQADLVISAAGSTCHELAHRGTPMALLSLTEGQRVLAQNMQNIGAAVWLGHFSEVSDDILAEKIRTFITQSDHRNLSSKAQSLIDGQGGQRILERFNEIHRLFHESQFSPEQVRSQYESSAQEKDDFAKVRWGSHQGMVGGLEMCLDQVQWDWVKTWLDVGSGTGDCYALFRTRGKKVQSYLGIDLSLALVELSEKKNAAFAEARFSCTNLFDPKLAPHDLVSAIGVLQNCGASLDKAMARLTDLVKPGGQLFLTTKNLDWKEFKQGLTPEPLHLWFTENELRQACAFCRLKILEFKGLEPKTKKIVGITDSHTVFILAQKEGP